MKTKLLFWSLILCSGLTQAQQPVASFYAPDAVYDIVTSTTAINQNISGANVTWNFTALNKIGTSTDTNLTPTAGELSSFPGTTQVIRTTSTIAGVDSELRLYTKYPSNILSFTGVQNSGLLLNFSTNNATLGGFPMEYGFANTDTTSGTYDNGQYSGTFSGTINTNVDGYGTMNLTGTGFASYSGNVTRLKTTQTINLNYGLFTNVGTVNIVSYSYYDPLNMAHVPQFRYTSTTVNVPLLSINQTLSQMEVFSQTVLATDQQVLAENAVNIFPNPVADMLYIETDQKVKSLRITDIGGKTVLVQNTDLQTADVSQLGKGVYFATITTDLGTVTRKIVKK